MAYDVDLSGAAEVNLTFMRSDTIHFVLEFTDDAGDPITGFANWEFLLEFKRSTEDDIPVISASSEDGEITVIDATHIEVIKQTDELIGEVRRNKYRYDLRVKLPGDIYKTYWYGRAVFRSNTGDF
jgi:hypothetical protein